MTASTSKIVTRLLAAAALIVVAATSVLYLQNNSGPEIPQVDLSLMEPRVSTQIRRHQNAVAAKPRNADAWANLAQAFHAHDLFSQAILAYHEAMELNPGDSRWPYLAALAQAKSDPAAALPLYRQAIALQPANAAVYINFGDILVRSGEHDDAVQAYRRALTIDADSTHALYGLAQVALITNDPASALELLERAETIAPYHGEIHSSLAQAHQRLGHDDEARRQVMLARAWPDSTRAHDPVVQAMESLAADSQSIARKGAVLAKRGEYRAAEAKFREVLEIRPALARDYANLGGALVGQGRAEAALEAYRRGLEIEPDDVDTLNNLGYTLLQLQRYAEAEKYLSRAVEIAPGFAAALGNLGLLAEQQQQMQRAISYFEQALVQNPGLLFARNALASQLASEGDTAAAITHWRTVLDINPRELTAIYMLAGTLAARGEHAEAIGLLRAGFKIAPDSSRLVAALAWELATVPEDDLRNGAEALQMAQRLHSAYPERPEILDIVAAALAETGDFEGAVQLMEKAVELGGGKAMVIHLKAYRLGRPWRQTLSTDVRVSLPDR